MILEDFGLWAPVLGLLLFGAWPYIYIAIRRGKNRFLFLSACVGAISVTEALIMIASSPFVLFNIKIFPVLYKADLAHFLDPALSLGGVVLDWYSIGLVGVLYPILPVLIYQRYEMFRINKQGLGTALQPPQP